MKVSIFDLTLASMTDEVNLSPFGDLHLDSPECDLRELRRVLKQRAALPNSLFLGLGDTFNAVLPGDVKRYQPSALDQQQYGTDNLLDTMVARAAKELSPYPWLLFAQGNHEHAVEKNHFVNLTRRLAARCRLPSFAKPTTGEEHSLDGGYSGYLRLRLWDPARRNDRSGRSGPRASIDLAYHHGAWTGDGIPAGARKWVSSMHGARIYLFGHSHACAPEPIVNFRVNTAGRLVSETGFIVMCGTYLKSISISDNTNYGEKGGYKPRYIGTPLITLRLNQDREAGQGLGARVSVRATVEA